jgi:hypothetical protein
MPAAFNEVLEDVLRERIARQLGEGRSIRLETIAFWNAVTSHDHGTA